MVSPKIVLKCKDGREFEVSKAVALQMQNIKHKIKEDHEETIIPVPELSSLVVAKLLQYCERHALDNDDNNLKSFDDDFVKLPEDVILDVDVGARKLGVTRLVDILCQEITDMIKVKSVEETRKFFNIKNDFTPEEEQQIYNENLWVFQ